MTMTADIRHEDEDSTATASNLVTSSSAPQTLDSAFDTQSRGTSSDDTRTHRPPSSSTSSQPRFMLDGFHTPKFVSSSAFRRASRSRPTSSASQSTTFLPLSTSTNELHWVPQDGGEQFPVDVGEDEDDEDDDAIDGGMGEDGELEDFQVMSVVKSPASSALIERPWPTSAVGSTSSELAGGGTSIATPKLTQTPPASFPSTSTRKEAEWSRFDLADEGGTIDGKSPFVRSTALPITGSSSSSPPLPPLPPLPYLLPAHTSAGTSRSPGPTSDARRVLPPSRSTPDPMANSSVPPRARSTSHARSMSISTSVSSTTSDAGPDRATTPGTPGSANGMQSRLRTLSDNLKRMSIHKRPSIDSARLAAQPQHQVSRPANSAHNSPPPTASSNHHVTPARARKSSLTIESLASYQPSNGATKMDEVVQCEVLRPDEVASVAASESASRNAWSMEARTATLLDVRPAGWNLAKEGDRGDKVISLAQRQSAFPLRKRASDTGMWQATERSAESSSSPARISNPAEVLVPSNFNSNSNPSSRSASQLSGYARRKTSVSSESVVDHSGSDNVNPESARTTVRQQLGSGGRTSHSPSSWQEVGNIETGPLPPRRRSRAGSMGAGGVRSPQSTSIQQSVPPSAWASSSAATPVTAPRRQSTGSETARSMDQASRAFSLEVQAGLPASPTYPKQEWQHVPYGGGGGEATRSAAHDSMTSDVNPVTLPTTSSHGHAESLRPSHVSLVASFNEFAGADAVASPALQTTLDEEDIDVLTEEPYIETDTDLYVIRRRLVKQFSNLGSKRRAHRSDTASSREGRGEEEHASGLAVAVDELKLDAFSSEKERRKAMEALQARERALTIEALSKAEMAYAHIEVWTESRKGKWTVRGPAHEEDEPSERLPEMHSVWAYPIDAKGIVRRNKLKSNIEISSSRTVVVCPDCRQASSLRIAHNCATCQGSERVEMAFVVQCTVRLAQFLPLKLPASLLAGTEQSHIKYVDVAHPDIRAEILRERAVAGLQGAAARVIRVHHEQHGSRLLMGRVRISRRGRLTVGVKNVKGKSPRTFDIDDGADGKMVEVVTPSPAVSSEKATSSSSRRNSHIGRILSSSKPTSAGTANMEQQLEYGGVLDVADENVDGRSFRSGFLRSSSKRKDLAAAAATVPASLSNRPSAPSIHREMEDYGGGGRATTPSPHRTPKASSNEFQPSSQTLSGKKSIRSIFRQKTK